MPDTEQLIYAEIVLRARTGASLMVDDVQLSKESIHLYHAPEDTPSEVSEKLKNAGFTVLAASSFGVSIVGPQKLMTDYFKTRVLQRPVQMLFGAGRQIETPTFVMADTPHVPDPVAPQIEAVYLPRKGYFLSGEGPMPTPAYYALKPPTDISRLTNADHAHTRGVFGTNVNVGMVDSGFILNHDYYQGKGYNITVHAVIGSANLDEYGHGTGIASNLLAVAPKCNFHFYKMSDGVNWASLAAFRAARQGGMRVITCSWGQNYDPVLEAEIIAAVHTDGITVLFAAGNGGYVGWPGAMPDVISVGGAYPLQGGGWTASSYASSGTNAIYPSRHCPDVSGIVGQAPMGIFIVVPTMKGAQFDQEFANGGPFPNGDETGPNDGWMVASGTSSATPQVAGAAALLLEAKSSLTPDDIKLLLQQTAIDVTTGASASGESAGVGPDSATGAGVIDIGAAVDSVKPSICKVAPLHICPTGPVKPCLVPPVQVCKVAPRLCSVAPVITRCKVPPMWTCRIAPVLRCPPAPKQIGCPPAPMPTCAAGPTIGQGPERGGDPARRATERLVPYTVMVDQSQAQEWIAQELAKGDDVGVEGEYEEFPGVQGCVPGPFSPKIR